MSLAAFFAQNGSAVESQCSFSSVTCVHILNNDLGRKGQFSCLIVHVCLQESNKRTAIWCDNRNLHRFISAKIRHFCGHNFIWKRNECMPLALIFHHLVHDHFEGSPGDFPHHKGTRILHTPPLPRKTLMSLMW